MPAGRAKRAQAVDHLVDIVQPVNGEGEPYQEPAPVGGRIGREQRREPRLGLRQAQKHGLDQLVPIGDGMLEAALHLSGALGRHRLAPYSPADSARIGCRNGRNP